jgi:hypothetical protein
MLEGMKRKAISFHVKGENVEVYIIFNSIVCRKLYFLTFCCSYPAGQYSRKPQACTNSLENILHSLIFLYLFLPLSSF